MATDGRALSLGALFHDLRGGFADRGFVRVFIEFRLESSTRPAGNDAGPALSVRRGFRAELDYRDEVLERAHLISTGMSPRPVAEVVIARQEDRHLYSCDGGARFGPLRDTPRLFDLYWFESQLHRVAVDQVSEEADPQPDGSPGRILRVGVEPEEFVPLIRLFGDDPADMTESLDLSGCSALLTSGAVLGIHYRWQTSGEELIGDHDRYLSRHRSRVTIQLLSHDGTAATVALDPVLPTLAGLDDVWEFARAGRDAGEPMVAAPA